MIIDVRKLKYSGKYDSEFTCYYTPSEGIISLPGAVLNGQVCVTGTLALHGDDVYVDGTVSCKIVGECARCLKSAEYNFSSNFSVVYATERQDEDDYLYTRGLVDLTPAVNDVLLTDFPTVIYCKENCKGICPVCGQDLNESSCDCKY
ncbi:MAG: DUF177 domain-containing protein [Clostridia bacterium]|nr:DUF177 domain-containing protein [Clostridia bacterium]